MTDMHVALGLALRFPKATIALALITAFGIWFNGTHPAAHPATATTYAELGGTLSDSVSPATWAGALLAALHDPDTGENDQAVMAWERAEGGNWQNNAQFNPLNTTQREPGSTPINSVGVQAYTSWDEGLRATVQTLENGRYGSVLAALAAGDCAPCVADAVGASSWGTGRFSV